MANHFMTANLILLLGLLLIISLHSTVAQIGICYGTNGKGLPSPCEAVGIYEQHNIQRMRIYEPDQAILGSLRGSSIELTLGLPNIDHLQFAAASQDNADEWVRKYVLDYPDVRFRHIIVGNEVSPIRADTAKYVPYVLQAMQHVYNAISAAGLADQIKVSTSIDTGVLANSYPPEDGEFRSDVTPYLDPIINFLVDTGTPLFAHIYPYFSYLGDPEHIDLRYALLDPTYDGVVTPSGTRYQNLFHALVDAVYAALEKRVKPTPEVIGGESGHSSGGGHKLASLENAQEYINNLIQVVKQGTPKRPDQPVETYIFAMFDENLKDGPEDERYFGLFTADGQPKYPVVFD